MGRVCPRPCSRLMTAAVYLSVGIVQLIMGVILLRSKYVFLLAGPDFWTSCSNIAAGSVLGVSASVWKDSTKHLSKKHRTRRNILVALYFAALIINGTTLGIMLLGEGNTLLSIRIEKGGPLSTFSLAKEILAYAYATSVCSPIVCIVVSIVGISGTIFQSPKSKCMADDSPGSSILKGRAQSHEWVFTPDSILLQKPAKQVSFSESSEEGSPGHGHPPEHATAEELRRALRMMDSLPSDTTAMLQHKERRRKNRYEACPTNPSPPEAVILKSRDTELHQQRKDLSRCASTRESQRPTRSSHGSSGYVTMDHLARTPWPSPDDVFDGQDDSPDLATRLRMFREHGRQSWSELDTEELVRFRDYMRASHKLPRPLSQADLSMELRKLEHQYDAMAGSGRLQTSAESSGCFSPDSSDSFEASRTTGRLAGQVVPIGVRKATSARRLVPVQPPEVPQRQGSALSTVQARTSPVPQAEGLDESGSLASFRNEGRKGSPETDQDYPRKCPPSAQKQRMTPMKSISEEPGDELPESPRSCKESSSTSNHESMLPSGWCRESLHPSGSSRESLHPSGSSRESLHPSGSSREALLPSGSSRDILHPPSSETLRTGYLERESPGKLRTPKRRATLSCKRIRDMWSSSAGTDIEILDKIVDADSLIGLSEQELMNRQMRTRSIREVVQQRLKEQEITL